MKSKKVSTFLLLACTVGYAFSKENVLLISYEPFIGSAIEGRSPPIIIVYNRKLVDKWDAGLVLGDLNLSHDGTPFIEISALRYFGENNSGFTIGLSYDAQWYANKKENQAYLVQSIPIGFGYRAKWKYLVHDIYVGYGPSLRDGKRISNMAVGHLALGVQF